ncbi:hypothetical protein N7492_005640 [Penicillium capsulatum]|uniref:Uncharacterized protein n=1 Tax=Penicillium capsulatum TaxID=69766 RepID=A0A9W9IDS3_9EURO|nr:hypothetical protein N7492_005640 [Penicillium capsulatum]KAJ6135262.1 hypothetical protein N7512_000422 [Penicillium capsulatum]
MAPLYTRQNHSLIPAPPRPPKGPSTPPVEVTTSIDPKVFAELFAGTVGIFFLAVVVWKTGQFIRSFSRHRVLKKGNLATDRYARTWYGWIPLETHQRNKAFFIRIFTHLSRWTAWKSTRTDYRWVWWDPEQEAMKARGRDQRSLRWLPECIKSYEATPADAIWNCRPQVECHGILLDGSQPEQPPSDVSSPRSCETIFNPSSQRCSVQYSRSREKGLSISKEASKGNRMRSNGFNSDSHSEDSQWSNARTARNSLGMSHETGSLSHASLSRSSSEDAGSLLFSNCDGSSSPKQFGGVGRPNLAYLPSLQESAELSAYRELRVPYRRPAPRKHRAWSAQMQVKKQLDFANLRDSSGPPGTPATDILGSVFSEASASGSLVNRGIEGSWRRRTPLEKISLAFDQKSTSSQIDPDAGWNRGKYPTVPIRHRPTPMQTPLINNAWQSLRTPKAPLAKGTTHDAHFDLEVITQSYHSRRYFASGDSSNEVRPAEELVDCEVRLVDQLDRKLMWMFNETTPGQKPYHFARLANHWLNRETWIVIDPVSRISIDKRRERGDPRFNVPYPERDFGARPKYPVPLRRRAYRPRIDSWRAAVNRQRRVSGVRDAIRTVMLYEDSAEEPPDGKIDTACWMLPKPPQGFDMSTNQKNAWYEGGYGWQEKLENWQQVRRGYRLHQAIHEGRANRNRVKELARNVNERCRTVSAKLIPRELVSTASAGAPEL